jgi:hypothetical protein
MRTKTIKYKNAVDLFRQLFELMYDVCRENDWQDPFSYARAKEIHLAGELGHEVSSEYSGADATDEDGKCEYKTTIVENIKASYTGISVKETWREQIKYLKEEKIANYKNHYHARYNFGRIEEVFKMSGEQVLELILPKLIKGFNMVGYTKKGIKKADPRLAATLTSSEIRKYGTQIR